MQFSKGLIVQVKIKDIAFGGNAVGNLYGDEFNSDELSKLVVFVEGGALIGEIVEVSLTRIKKSFLEARLVNIIEASLERTTPRCKHYSVCGGCSLQHVPYESQLAIKDRFVRDALTKIGGFERDYIESIKQPIIGCESPWYYRNKSEFTFEDEAAGFHPSANYKQVFNVEECFLQSELAIEILDAVRTWAKEKNVSTYSWKTHDGFIKNLVVREGKNTGDVLVNLITTTDSPHYDADFTSMIQSKFKQITSIYRTAVLVKRGFKTVTEEKHLFGKKVLTEKLIVNGKSLEFDILPHAFFQTNSKQAERLYETTVAFAQPESNDHVLDLFCGTGTIGMFCALTGCKVTGIDVSDSAIINAKKNAEHNCMKNIEFHVGDTGKQISKLNEVAKSATVLITDPPRSGIDPKTLEKLIALNISRWVYVSCNPATLARDLKIIVNSQLSNGKKYKLTKVQPVDMFPQTFHVETVTLIEAE